MREIPVQYRPDIDGLRAIAVLGVVFYHAGLGLTGGFVGVDVFFVISGYLITRLLLRDLQAGTFSLQAFWERRIRRLLPALLAMLLVTLGAAFVILLPQDLIRLGNSLMTQPLLAANLFFWRAMKHGYFGDFAEIYPTLHTWSLAVEEQFYLLYPVLLAALYPRWRNGLSPLLLAGAAVSLYLSQTMLAAHSVLAFFTLPCRAWELLLGALVSLLRQPRLSRAGREGGALVGLLLILWAMVVYGENTPFPGWRAAVPCLGTALLLFCNACGDSLVRHWLSSRIMVGIGLISYSFYLWHWPVFSLTAYRLALRSSWPLSIALVGLSLVLGFLSWKYVETPFRTSDWLKQRGRTWALAASSGFSLLLLGLGLRLGAGFPQGWPQPALRFGEAREHMAFIRSSGLVGPLEPDSNSLGDMQVRKLSFLLWGDSHAMAYAPGLDAAARKAGIRGLQLTRSATPPLFQKSAPQWGALCLDTVKAHHIREVFLCGHWGAYGPQVAFPEDFADTLRRLQEHGCRIWFVRDFPYQPVDPPLFLAFDWRWGSRTGITGLGRDQYRFYNRHADQAMDRHARSLRRLDPEPWLVDSQGNCLIRKGDISLYRDSNHLSTEGGIYLQPLFEGPMRAVRERNRQ